VYFNIPESTKVSTESKRPFEPKLAGLLSIIPSELASMALLPDSTKS
jgi:hypothetical protein